MAKEETTRPEDGGATVPEESVLAAMAADGDLGTEVRERVRTHRLPGEVAAYADRYESVVGIRDRFLWKWFHHLSPSFRLSAVDDGAADAVRRHKTLLTVYATLLDDLLEAWGDRETFERAAALPFTTGPVPVEGAAVDEEYLALTRDVWAELEAAVDAAPYGDSWAALFRFDLRQVINSIRYAYVVTSTGHVANMTEAYVYGSHNMVVFPYADLDLMHAPAFDRAELPQLRRLLWYAQQMARIGNWVSTWERELGEFDYSSGVVIRALERDVVTREDLLAARDDPALMTDVREAIAGAGIEDELLGEWVNRYSYLHDAVELSSVSVEEYLDGMETVLRFQLGARGAK